MSAVGLGIDTTFDDTSVAILQGKSEILANLTLSQYQEHEEFGGVVPERASRKHLEVIHHLIDGALKEANLDFFGNRLHCGFQSSRLAGFLTGWPDSRKKLSVHLTMSTNRSQSR